MRAADAYLQAARTAIRANTTLFPDSSRLGMCEITMDDRPHPWSGIWFIGLYKGDVRRVNATPQRLYEEVSLMAAITYRTTDTPSDRVGPSRISKVEIEHGPKRLSIDEIADEVINTLSNNEQILVLGNDLICNDEATAEWPLMTPLTFLQETTNGPQVVDNEHFRAAPGEEQFENDDHGLLLKLTFDGGKRYSPQNVN